MWMMVLFGCLPDPEPQTPGPDTRSLDHEAGSPIRAADTTADGVALLPSPARRQQWVVWGDPHAHTGMSQDSCENQWEDCRARVPGRPGEGFLEEARGNGLDWFAVTDHVDFDALEDLETGAVVEIWPASQDLVARAPELGLFGMLGYEWSASCPGRSQERPGHHRTVLLEEPDACGGYRPVVCKREQGKLAWGLEYYHPAGTNQALSARQLEIHLDTVPEGCEPSRWVSFVHHGAYARPARLDWSNPGNWMRKELLVEIYSEHGSSECVDLDQPGCRFEVQEDWYAPEGSVQAALSQGLELGFVAGTDSHDARPGSVADGPGYVLGVQELEEGGSAPFAARQYSPGGVTGVLLGPGEADDRDAFFDALLRRHTVAATRVFPELEIRAVDTTGAVYLPGDRLPIGTYKLELVLDHPATLEMVSPDGSVEVIGEWFTVSPGQPRYLRVRMLIDGREHRIWASPFFPAG